MANAAKPQGSLEVSVNNFLNKESGECKLSDLECNSGKILGCEELTLAINFGALNNTLDVFLDLSSIFLLIFFNSQGAFILSGFLK